MTAKLKELAEKATKGRWAYDDGITSLPNEPVDRGKLQSVETIVDGKLHLIAMMGGMDDAQDDHDGRFIAAANPETILELLARCARMEEAARKRLEYGCNDTCDSRLIDGYKCSCGHAELAAALLSSAPVAREGE